MKLKSKASLVMAATVVLALIATGVGFRLFLEKSLRSSIYAGLEGVAETAAGSMHRFVAGSLRDARAVAAGFPMDAMAKGDAQTAQAYLARMGEIFPQFDNGLFILDAQGRLWADHPNLSGLHGQSFAFRDYFQRTKSTGQGVVGQPYRSSRSKEPVCTFTAPLADAQGNLLGVVGCSVKLLGKDSLGAFQKQVIGDTGYLFIIDQTRLLIMHPRDDRILQRDAPLGANLLLDQALDGFEGVGDTVNSRGVPMLVAFKRVPQTDWLIAAQQPRSEALAPLKKMLAHLLLGTLIGTVLAVLVGLWVIRSISKPISDLSKAAAALGREPFKPDDPILSRGDEIGELARSFRNISLSLQRSFSELRETEQRLKTAQGVAHVGSWELDLATGKVWGSEEAGRIYGLPESQSGDLPFELIKGVCLAEDRPRLDQAMADLLAQRTEYALEFRIRRPQDQEIRGIYSCATLVPGQDGAPGKVVGTIQDITERQKAETAIRRRTEELTALNALGHDLNQDLSLQHTVAAALSGLRQSLGPDMAFLFLRQGDRLVLQGSQTSPGGRMPTMAAGHEVGQCICGLAAQRRQSLFSPDIFNDQRCTWAECQAAGVKSLAAIPLLSAGEVIGVMGMASLSQRNFQQEADFLETHAGQVSVAIANARLFEKVQEELAQHQETLKALRESQDRYRALSDESPLGISLIAKDDRYEYVNPAFMDIFGYTLADIPTRNDWFRLAYPDEDYRREVTEEWAQDVAHVSVGRVATRTLRITSKAGVGMSILLRVVPLSSGGHFIIYEDITERLRAEDSLRRSEERFRRFIERSPIAIAVTNPDQGFEYVNPKFTLTFGYDMTDLPDLEHWWVAAYPDPDYRREVREAWNRNVAQAHLADTEVEPVERRVRCKDGSDKMIAFSGAPVGEKTIVVMQDITKQWEAGQALMESEAKFRRFVEATPVGIHMFRLEAPDRLVFSGYNLAADRILGLDHHPLLGRTIQDAFPSLADTDIPGHYLRVAREGATWRDENVSYQHGRISGAYEVMAFQTASGTLAAMFNDITQRLRAQEELRILEQQLVRSQKLEALGTLAGGIAHDFNNILQALRGRAELLAEDQALPEPTRHHIGNIQRSIIRATDLVARMLSFSRAGESKLAVLDLNREVLSAVEMLDHVLPKMVAIETRLCQETGLIMGDANRLEQVILNLGTNARDAMPEGGTLLFRTCHRSVTEGATLGTGLPPGEYMVMEVSDNGQGMDDKTLSHIFEPFFTTKEPGKGTGLGLYSAYGIIREHGGTITCQSRPGHGTTFTMLFPRAQAEAAQDQAQALPDQSALGSDGSETVLVVDDEPEILAPLCEALALHGYFVHRARSGEEALALLEMPGMGVDVILMDLNMPGMGGEKALLEIKAGHPEVRVIVASGYQDRTMTERILEEGADLFIGKPFDFKKLLASIHEVLAGRRVARTEVERGS